MREDGEWKRKLNRAEVAGKRTVTAGREGWEGRERARKGGRQRERKRGDCLCQVITPSACWDISPATITVLKICFLQLSFLLFHSLRHPLVNNDKAASKHNGSSSSSRASQTSTRRMMKCSSWEGKGRCLCSLALLLPSSKFEIYGSDWTP